MSVFPTNHYRKTNRVMTKELIDEYVSAHGENRWMDASELESLLTEFAEKLHEPVNEDLSDLIDKLSKRYPEVSFAKLSRIVVAATKWQKSQDQQNIELAEEHAMLAGMMQERERMIKDDADLATVAHLYGADQMKEIMLNKAVEVEVFDDWQYGKDADRIAQPAIKLRCPELKIGQKVKVIIIKE